MPNDYTQDNRPMRITTPLGKDKLLITSLQGSEAISQIYRFQVELLADNKTPIDFDKLLGQEATVELQLADDKKRYFSGIVSRFSQGDRDENFTAFRAEIVPKMWLLTRRTQSRIFQHLSVPEILKKVLEELDVKFEIQGTFEPRDYCVQYRESDFDFASRLMEEEGIYYFFQHRDGGHEQILGNSPATHPEVPGDTTAIFEKDIGGVREDDRVFEWEKVQELRSGKTTLWDHCFELPHKHLEADKEIVDSVQVGTVTHKLRVGGNDKLELYDYPGAYASRFDGIAPGGGERSADLQKIFADNCRTAEIRMQQEAVRSLIIEGASNCRQFISGNSFTLDRHFNANGAYLLTSVTHRAEFDVYRSGSAGAGYSNKFTCIPLSLPFSPAQVTPRPTVSGAQTAVVVGPPGEEIFTDKYGRVKVQFHWDRQGQNNADSSCWIRVASPWAGKSWGAVSLPRIGQEVLVDFVEGDPNDPIVVGSVYNADMMPPYKLPADKTQSGVLTRSSPAGNPETCNELCFEDKKGEELVYLRAEKVLRVSCENDEIYWVGHDRSDEVENNEVTTIGVNRTESVGADEEITIGASRTETVGSNESITIGNNRTKTVGKNEQISIGGSRSETVEESESITVGSGRSTTIGKDDSLNVGKTFAISAGNEIVLTTGDASITMKKDGTISISGTHITINGMTISLKADMSLTLKSSQIAIN